MNQTKKVIILYGPPGVGKLTVAKELSRKVNFKLFHVHLLADLVKSIFDFGTKNFADTFTDLWLFLFEKTLSTNIKGIIATLVYGVQTLEGKKEDQFFAKIVKLANKYNADLFFIKLKCSDEELEKRVKSESRKKYNKITDPNILKKLRKKYKVDQQIPFFDSIEIDTTKLSSTQTATMIKNTLKLK